jgi:hypothetical protein
MAEPPYSLAGFDLTTYIYDFGWRRCHYIDHAAFLFLEVGSEINFENFASSGLTCCDKIGSELKSILTQAQVPLNRRSSVTNATAKSLHTSLSMYTYTL